MRKWIVAAVSFLFFASGVFAAPAPLLTGQTASSHAPPSGWTTLKVDGFETGSNAPGTWINDYYGNTVSTANPHTGTYSVRNYHSCDGGELKWGLNGQPDATGPYQEIYVSFWEYFDPQAVFETELIYFTNTYGIPGTTPMMRNNFSQWFATGWLGIEMAFVVQGEGTSIAGGGYRDPPDFAWYGPRNNVKSVGTWVQREFWHRPNTPGQSNGFIRIYTNGVLEKEYNNVNLNGNAPFHEGSWIQVGGVATYHQWRDAADPYYGTCCEVESGPGCVAYDRVWNFDACGCPNQCPPSGSIPKYYRYIDDIIVMKYAGTPSTDDTQPPYALGHTPSPDSTVPITTTSQTLSLKDDRTYDEGILSSTISLNGPSGTKTCSTGLVCTGDSSSYQVVYGGLSLSYDQVANWTLTATDNAGNTHNSTWHWHVESAVPDNLAITTSSLPSGVVGQSYSASLAADGGTTPYTWVAGDPPSPIPGAPYPSSSTISSFTWDFQNAEQDGTGSDRWPHTWGFDNNVWTLWSDGGGMDGTNTVCRTRVGTGYITNDPPGDASFTVVQGCMSDDSGCSGSQYSHNPICDAPNATTSVGFAEALLSVAGTLYRIVALEDDSDYRHSQLQTSTDNGATWSDTITWDNVVGTWRPMEFIQFGMDYAGALDSNIYMIGPANALVPTNSNAYDLYLGRVDKTQIDNTAAYEYFTGTAESPSWGTWANRAPFISDDTNGFGHLAISYNAPLDVYIASGIHGPFTNCGSSSWKCWGDPKNLGIFEAPNPWGPWRTIVYTSSWHGFDGDEGWGLKHVYPTKWISGDGLEMWGVWSGYGVYDSYNRLKATLTLYGAGEPLPPGLSVDSSGSIVGVPTTAGTYVFDIGVTDSETGSDSKELSITIAPSSPGGQISTNLTSILDTYINSGSTGTNYSTDTLVKAYQWPDYTVANRMLYRVDISSIPANATIDSSALKLYMTGYDSSGGENPMALRAYRVTGSVPDITTVTWASFAGSLSSPEQPTNVSLVPGVFSLDVTNMMQNAYGAAATYLYIAVDGGADGWADTNRGFASMEHATSSWRPVVNVVYTPGEGGGPLPSTHAPGKVRWKQGRGHFKSWK